MFGRRNAGSPIKEKFTFAMIADIISEHKLWIKYLFCDRKTKEQVDRPALTLKRAAR